MKDCCSDEKNLELWKDEPKFDVPPPRKDVITKRCKVCGRRHYEANAEAGDLGVTV